MQNVAQRLQAIDLKLKRWQTRLTRAHNAIVKLNQQRKRITNPKLMKQYDAYLARAVEETKRCLPPPKPQPDPVIEAKANLVQAIDDRLTEIAEPKKDDLAIPAFMLRPKTKQGTPEQRKAMPLSGKEALAAIKAQSAKVTAKRAKRELRIK